ncbi:ABC transporter ATP-binding protein [Sulfurisphaera ohwakuensis]|uniref:ABC-2 type transport system ATP-binding protein n=1 Tax=Sulfurisphaera ohwakuensis TaxID=69656 RepID=A0A650CEK2_SULOH|nr:ABC transporter ATP-binding protein [Sulfurisphaera ohwakuensis]MBB5252879.1 ABC-2 type transport system ATP-binding protein [Sulfurisphaera ohwakuensis]QGR16188.1 ATP-binding cassette domain-containing protein [Sulfurisphaera ohwakuensis]
MNEEIAISVINLRKKFGNFWALKDVNFTVKKGEVFGLIGPNGAGKTTTLRVVAGIIKSYEGIVKVFGLDPVKAKNNGYISYMPEDAFPYEKLTGIENLQFFAELYSRGDKRKTQEFVELGIKIANLGDKIYQPTSTYSRGMKRRLIIARTLMVMPKLAILDEPTSALDVDSAVRVRNTIVEMSKKYGITIILSSHNMLEVQYMCDNIAMINDGKTIISGSPNDIIEKLKVKNLEEAFMKVISNA